MPTSSRPTIAAPPASAPRWIVAGLALLATLVLLEVIARLEGTPVCADATETLLESDPKLGWTYAKGQSFAVAACAPEGAQLPPGDAASVRAWRAPVSVNAAGLADQEWTEEKRPDEVRVLLLGNQTADGIGVARADRLSVRLMHLADRVRGARVSAINATIAGYATAEEQRLLEQLGLRYHPDIVVLLIDPERDLRAIAHPARELAPSEPLPPAGGLLDLSATARWLARHPASDGNPPVRLEEPPPLASDDARSAALAHLVQSVTRLAETARAGGARFAVLIAPPCPPPRSPGPPSEDFCKAIGDVAPCTDLRQSFAEVARDATHPVELCLPGLERWGRDAHFLASLRVWDLLQGAGLWPASVVRGYRL